MKNLVSAITEVVWGTPMLALLMGCGIYLTIRLNGFQITRLRLWGKETFGALFAGKSEEDGKISPYQAVTSALASSIGSGSVVGVATAITAGGAGTIFWMWLSAFFGMATKYTEIFLAVKFRVEKNGTYYGGPMYYIEKALGSGYKWMAHLFAFSGAFACLGMGAMNQSNSIAAIMQSGAKIPLWVSGIALGLVTAIAISGGISRISRVAEKLVPLLAFLYLFGGIAIICMKPISAKNAVCEIFRAAFLPQSMYGAAAGEMARRAIRYGVARGVFSNEAGLGSAPIVHAAANAKSPTIQGFWGVFEVFVDTMIICTVTAITIISSGLHTGGASGVVLVTSAFSEFFGDFGAVFVGVATVMFSLTTILGWSYYGERCAQYLTKERKSTRCFYRVLFVVAVIAGACMCMETVWELADMFNGIMMIPNLIAVVLLSGIVIRESKSELK